MNYRIENLLPVVAELARKYTSGESSSVSYETANRLMDAVLYCIGECQSMNALQGETLPDEALLYRQGAALVLEKVYEAKSIYERIIGPFDDYGCKNYGDTIRRGIPAFFVRYDPVFAPGDHLLTLDYPLLCGNPPLRGIDLILEYLKGIQLEMCFLGCFDPEAIRRLLRRVSPEYREFYLDNLCEPVLLCAAMCALAGSSLGDLELSGMDLEKIRELFQDKRPADASPAIRAAIRTALKRMPGSAGYFERAADGFALRVVNGIAQGSLENVLYLDAHDPFTCQTAPSPGSVCSGSLGPSTL